MFKCYADKIKAGMALSLISLLAGRISRAASPAQPQELAQLRDIQLPEPIDWWPLAYGWYVLIILLLTLLLLIAFYIVRRFTYAQPKRQALHLLESYQQQYLRDHNTQLASARISELLKRVALVYFPRAKTASLTGEEWLRFLNETGNRLDFNQNRQALLEWPYHPVADAPDQESNMALLFKTAREWITQRRKPCGR